MTTKALTTLFFLLGELAYAGGIVVLFKVSHLLSIVEIRVLISVALLIFGEYWFQASNVRHLRDWIEAIEKQQRKM